MERKLIIKKTIETGFNTVNGNYCCNFGVMKEFPGSEFMFQHRKR